MRKRLFNIFIVIAFVLSCGFLSACANRYKKMEFAIQYAFVNENGEIDQWRDVGSNLSLNFGNENDELKIDENGSNLVFKVNVKNVKSKYIDDIVVSENSSSFSKIVKQDESFALAVDGVKSSSIRIYETKSGKETSFRLNIFESLKNITANTSFKPALTVGQSVNLDSLISANQNKSALIFDPINTNQTAVDYSIASLGYYRNTDEWLEVSSSSNRISLNGNILEIKTGFDSSVTPIVKIKATSRYYSSEDNEISATFDVYVIEDLNSSNAPVLTESPNTSEPIQNKTLYVNNGSESKFELYAGIANIQDQYNSKYIDGVIAADGEKAYYSLNVYVDGQLIDMDDNNYHGMRIQLLQQATSDNRNLFKYEISADEETYLTYPKCEVKFELVVHGLNYVVQTPRYAATVNITKRSVVKDITLNGQTQNEFSLGKIYSSTNSSSSYAGLNLLVDVSPNDNMGHSVLISATEGLQITGRNVEIITPQTINGEKYTMSVINGSTITVNFAQNADLNNQKIMFTTLLKTEDSTGGYLAPYTLNVQKVVTANRFELFSSLEGTENFIDKTFLTDAKNETKLYLKVYYSGNNLALGSINLSMQNGSKFTFINGKTAINLEEDFSSASIVSERTGQQAGESYSIYSIPVKATNSATSAAVTISAGEQDGYALFENSFTLKSVFVASNGSFSIKTEGSNIFRLGDDNVWNYAIVNNVNLKSEIQFGQILTDGNFDQSTVANVTLTRTGNAVNFIAIGNPSSANKFQIWGVNGGQTSQLTANINYYIKNSESGAIEQATPSIINFEVAVFNSVNRIDMSFATGSSNQIVYINEKYPKVASTTLSYSARSLISSPSSSVSFSGNKSFDNANAIKLNCVNYSARYVEIYAGDTKLNLDNNGNLTGYLSSLSGNLTVKLIKKPEGSAKQLILMLSAYSFDNELQITNSITINFGDYTASSGIELSGESLVNENNIPNLYMSFIETPDNGSVQSSFNAKVVYDKDVNVKYDDLDYQLFQIQQDDNGNVIEENGKARRIEIVKAENRLGIDISKNTVTITAQKALGGGMFVLRLVAQDSFNETSQTYDNFTELFITITDGSVKARYRINTEKDFENIKNNLTSHYVLARDLTINNHMTFNTFSGSISGKNEIIQASGSVASENRNLNIVVGEVARTDDLYLGIFAKLATGAAVTDLNLNVSFASVEIEQTSGDRAVYIGGLAGVIEQGVTIENVEFNVNFSNINLADGKIASNVFMGGVAGELATNFALDGSKVVVKGAIETSFSTGTLHFGGVAGSLTGKISGSYLQPSDLKELGFNVGLSVDIVNISENSKTTNVLVGGVAGVAGINATIQNLVLMGEILVSAQSTGFVAGIAGKTDGTTIQNSILLGVNVEADSNNSNLAAAGVVGQATGGAITGIKFISLRLADIFNSGIEIQRQKNIGYVSNKNGDAAGIVVTADENVQISTCAVDNFVKDLTFYSVSGKNVYGISNAGVVNQCYVRANLKGTNDVELLTNGASNSYFIGSIDGAASSSLYTNCYKIEFTTNGFSVNGVSYSDWASANKDGFNEITISGINSTAEIWATNSGYNTFVCEHIAENGNKQEYKFYAPYLKNNYLLIPSEINIVLNKEKLKEIASFYDSKYNNNVDTDIVDTEINEIVKHHITETAIINYYFDADASKRAEINTHNIEDLVTLSKVPNDKNTIGGIVYKIIKGYEYASIVNNNEIYFKGVSGKNYILVKAYSVFNPEACDYFLFYTQYWFNEIVLQGSNIQKVGVENPVYQLDSYKGAKNLDLEVLASNSYKGSNYSSLFDISDIEKYIKIEFSELGNNAPITITENQNLFNHFIINSKDEEGLKESASVTFSIKLNVTQYFGADIYPQVGEKDEKEDDYREITTSTLHVNITSSATALEFNTDQLEGESGETFALTATLHTGYVGKYDENNKAEDNDKVEITNSGDVARFEEPNHDSLRMKFEVLQGQAEYERLFAQANAETILDLFDIVAYNTYNSADKTYTYKISIQLKDKYQTRYLTDSIVFGVRIFAKTNEDIDGDTEIKITINPSRLSTSIIINNYAATSAEAMGNYTHLITSSQVETANITPGGNGGVLTIRMQPSYAHIKQLTLKSSELYVPSLNANVKVRFEQLIYHTTLDKYISISPSCTLTEDNLGVYLNLASSTADGINYSFDGTIYIHVVLDKKFSGLADEIKLTLDVTNADDTHIVKTKSLVTDFLPGVELEYDSQYEITPKDADKDIKYYLVQQKTYNNIATLKIYGYQFNANPTVSITYLDEKPVGLDIDSQWIDDQSSLVPNADGSYSMRLKIGVRNNVKKAFKVTVGMSLINNAEIVSNSKSIVFYPTDYILNAENTEFGFGSNLSLAINQARDLEFSFATQNEFVDNSNDIYTKLLQDLEDEVLATDAEFEGKSLLSLTDEEKASLKTKKFEKLKAMFSYKVNDAGQTSTFAEGSEMFIVSTTNYGSGEENVTYLNLMARGSFKTSVTFSVNYQYELDEEQSVYKLKFGSASNTYPYRLTITFNMEFYTATTRESAFAISSADQMFDSAGNCILGEGQNYVLTEDIEVEICKPITTKIASLDGNNKKIKIKNFVVTSDSSSSETAGYYGLFATIDASTLIYNLVVDYSEFNTILNGQLSLAYENVTSVVFGGLAAVNNGLIYNCDVVNAGRNTKTVNLLVNNSTSTTITFGGLVGINNGTITNSRVGRSQFTKIKATDSSQSSYTEEFGALNFVIGNRTLGTGQGFQTYMGGFVGINNAEAVVSSSYIANTSLYTYSINDKNTESKIAGFVAENAGRIAYSYVKGLESTISNDSPYSTGAKVEAYANANIAGFVYDNLTGANINNCFANIELVSKSAFMAGFVFRNNSGAKIAQCYAACTFSNVNGDTSLTITPEQPFVGADTTGVLSNGELENCYWYKDLAGSQKFIVAEEDGKPQATGLSLANFANTSNLVNFVFVLSNSRNDREEGIWSFYDNRGNNVKLPELTIANNVAHSFRYKSGESTTEDGIISTYTYATKFALGSKANPDIISSVQEFNDVFTKYGTTSEFTGYVRFIDDIDFASDKTAIKTRRQFVLGGTKQDTNVVTSSRTSVDGNGMSINNIYLDVGEDKEESVGLFAQINQAYVKNLNLTFSNGKFSTANSIYSGGLAGKITDSVIINISLDGANTTIQGANLVGGLAGFVHGQSLVYGISSNLNVATILSNTTELYSSTKQAASVNNNYEKTLSYAGGIVGVMDVNTRSYSNEGYNLSYLHINDNAVSENPSLLIVADYAGGVAGYIGKNVKATRLTFNVGPNNRIDGQYSAGGLIAASIGATIEASKVSAADEDNAQFKFDANIAKYVLDMTAGLDIENIGNTNLIESYNFGGGLIGVSIGSTIFSCYSKAGFYSGNVVGGLIGLDILSNSNYNYAVPFLDFTNGNMETLKIVGGLVGKYDNASNTQFGKVYSGLGSKTVGQSYLFSTIILDNSAYNQVEKSYTDNGKEYNVEFNNFIGEDNVKDHQVSQVYVGEINYTRADKTNLITETKTTGTIKKQMQDLYALEYPDVQLSTYIAVFGIWDSKYWNLNTNKYYFPLLTDEQNDNYEQIKGQNDFDKIKNNPSGSFKITDDINMAGYNGGDNFVFDVEFTGVLIGEKPDGTTPKVYNLHVAASNSNDDVGLFRATSGATFRNIEFSWMENGVGNGNAVSVKNFSGLSGQDEPRGDNPTEKISTRISAVYVTVGRTSSNTQTAGAELFKSGSTITGFAGLIYDATGTNIINSSFSGKVTATLNNKNAEAVGGIVAKGKTATDVENTDNNNTMSIVNTNVGKEQTTVFNFNAVEINHMSIGALAGELSTTAVSGNLVNNVKIEMSGSSTAKTRMAGLIGYAKDCNIENNKTVTTLTNNATNSVETDIAGLIGGYTLSTEGSGRKLENNHVNTTIETTGSVNLFTSAGIARVETQFETKIIQSLFTGSITASATNSTIGGAVANAKTDKENAIANVLFDQVLANVDIASTVKASGNATNTLIGGLFGEIVGNAKLSNTMNMGRIIPEIDGSSESAACNYKIGGLAGKAQSIYLLETSYSFSLTSVLLNNIKGSAAVRNENKNTGALFGEIGNLYVGNENSKTDYNTAAGKTNNNADIYYSTDFALLPEDSGLGANISAGVFIRKEDYHQKAIQTGLWSKTKGKLSSVQNSHIPYISSLLEPMREFEVFKNSTDEYVEGSAANPKTDYSSLVAQDNVYFLLTMQDSDKINYENAEVKGILVGDGGIAKKFHVKTISEKSAISNIHVAGNGEEFTAFADVNNGVIFNASVSGNVKLTAENGLFATTNSGLISFSNCSADISAGGSISAIAFANSGVISSCYVTGNIEVENGKAYTIAYQNKVNDNSGYIYNCYAASYVNVADAGEDKISLVGLEDGETAINGSNNFIDSLATPKDSQFNGTGAENKGAEKLNTYQLMSNVKNKDGKDITLLAGNWFTTAAEGKINLKATTFGYNYNYPIYNFNKYNMLTEGSELQLQEKLNVRATGDGKDNNFEISHLGVLSSIQGVIANEDGSGKKYKLTHDLDGFISKNESGNITNITWNAVGAYSSVSGFSGVDANAKIGFTGTFDGGYKKADETKISKHVIKNLSKNGLFTNINGATFSNIKFEGDFTGIVNSGALGCDIVEGGATVENVDISSLELTVASSQASQDYYGMLFGSYTGSNTSSSTGGTGSTETGSGSTGSGTTEEGSTGEGSTGESGSTGETGSTESGTSSTNVVTIKNLITKKTSTSGNNGANGARMTSNNNADEAVYYGLLFGKVENGTVNVNESPADGLYIDLNFGGNTAGIAGGLVGLANGLTLNADKAGTIVDLKLTNHQAIGGLIGSTTSNQSTIKNFDVQFEVNSESADFSASNFGGMICSVAGGSIKFDSCTIKENESSNSKGLKISMLDKGGYYGLLASSITSGSLTLDSALTIDGVYIVGYKGTYENSDNDLTQGFGGFVGLMSGGSLNISAQTAFAPKLASYTCANLGGIVGKYVRETDDEKNALIKIEGLGEGIQLKGVKNVGGVVGYTTTNVNFDSSNNYMTNGTKIATLTTSTEDKFAADLKTAENWGGLIGCFAGNNNDENTEKAYQILSGAINSNEIKIDQTINGLSVTNVGGVAGYMKSGIIKQCENKAKIDGGKTTSTSGKVDFYSIKQTLGQDGTTKTTARFINVGGVVGMVEKGLVLSCKNTAKISAYQTVGGIVGYNKGEIRGKFTKLEISATTAAEIKKVQDGTAYFTLNENNEYVQQFNLGETLAEGTYYYIDSVETNGKITGAINVGGVVGYNGVGGKIYGISYNGQVSGNTNVGGLVGFAPNGDISGNSVGVASSTSTATPAEGESTDIGTEIRGIFLHTNVDKGNNQGNFYTIPTSIGGLIGSTGKANTVTVNANIVETNITSVAEGASTTDSGKNSGTNVVSTISNYMFIDTSKSESSELVSLDFAGATNLEQLKVLFNEISTGWGGLIGTTSSNTALNGTDSNVADSKAYITTNKITTNMNMAGTDNKNASNVAVNVGAYFGAYYIDKTEGDTFIALPDLQNNSSVNGAYCVGGAVGYVYVKELSGSGGSGVVYTYDYAPTKTINVQENGLGMYVGGVFGRAKANFAKLSVNNNVNLHTDSSYYIGGLIGKFEGTYLGAESKENVTIQGDTVKNVGGLVGMLKVKGNSSSSSNPITVQGTHSRAFTINTIQNENYYDAPSNYEAIDSDNENEVTLYAMATYVNQDSFTISGSKTTYDHNPLYDEKINGVYTTQGWHKDYTAFKTMQRCIPMEQNNGAPWDSITTIYDAENIKAVATVQAADINNSTYIEDEVGKIKYTVYEPYPDNPALYSKFGYGTLYYKLVTNNGTTIQDLSGTPGDEFKEGIDKDYIELNNYYYIDPTTSEPKVYDKITFEYKVKYAVNKYSISGSMFEVTGGFEEIKVSPSQQEKMNAIKDKIRQYDENIKWLDIISGVISGLLMFTGVGLGLASIKGVIKLALKKIAIGMVAGVVSTMVVSGFRRTSLNLERNQQMAYLNSIQIIQNTKNQSSGYMATMYYRSLNYNIDKDGNGVLNTTSDNICTIDGQKYQIYSTTRPSDYYSHLWMLVNLDTGDVQYYSYKTDEDKIEKGYTQCKKYEYKNGYYWINVNAAELSYVPANLFKQTGCSTELPQVYKSEDGRYYIYGKFENGEYSYVKEKGNLLTQKEDGTYELNDATLSKDRVVQTATLKFQLGSRVEGSDYISGYNYFNSVYYTPGTNSTNGLPTRYAVYKKVNSKPSVGQQGLDWVEYTKTVYKFSEVQLNDLVDGKTYYKEENISSEFVYYAETTSEHEKTDLSGLSKVYKLDKTEILRNYYEITSIVDSSIGSYTWGCGSYSVEAAPTSFTNPYYNKNLNGALYNLTESDGSFVYKTEEELVQSKLTIPVDAEYYLWEGGYVVSNTKDASYGLGRVMTYFGSSEEIVGLEEAYINDPTTNYINPKYYKSPLGDGMTLGEDGYILKTIDHDGKAIYELYVTNYSFSLGYEDSNGRYCNDGKLYTVDLSYPSDIDSNSLNYNKYLNIGGNNNFKKENEIYTRYKFTQSRNLIEDGDGIPTQFRAYNYGNDAILTEFVNKIGKLKDEDWNNFNNYNPYVKSDGKTMYKFYSISGDPNAGSGRKTYFCESARILLSGYYYYYENGEWSHYETQKAGSFKID